MSAVGVLQILAACFGTVGLLLWLVGFAVGKGRRRGWRDVPGEWTRFEGRFTRSWQVEYRVEGATFHIMPVMNATSLAPSGPVDVAYDPGDPGRAVINTFYHRGGVLKLMGAGAVGVGFLLLLIVLLLAVGPG
ncbi:MULTISPECIES: DUF3592 domain-containing protein [unclassified Serinicoccus]|uniref:DUF3592 domain-containing protein n=1 Tax=unclassified Serinicoccus TaxID=2643101 RepID=UPI0038534576